MGIGNLKLVLNWIKEYVVIIRLITMYILCLTRVVCSGDVILVGNIHIRWCTHFSKQEMQISDCYLLCSWNGAKTSIICWRLRITATTTYIQIIGYTQWGIMAWSKQVKGLARVSTMGTSKHSPCCSNTGIHWCRPSIGNISLCMPLLIPSCCS